MNTPKSQNPEGKVVAHRWLRNGEVTGIWVSGLPSERQLEAQRACSEIEGVTWSVEYAYSEDALAAMQRRLEELAAEWASEGPTSKPGDEWDRGWKACRVSSINAIRAILLLRDGKGDGVSTAEGEGKVSGG